MKEKILNILTHNAWIATREVTSRINSEGKSAKWSHDYIHQYLLELEQEDKIVESKRCGNGFVWKLVRR